MGLITAAKRYDETKGFKFISYAVWWIRQAIITALARHARMVRLPYNQLALLSKLYKTHSRLEQEHGRKPSADELADCMELPVEKIKEMMDKSGVNISIYEPFQGEDNYTLLDVLPSNEASADFLVEQKAITREIHYSMKVLSKRDRELLVMFFGLGSFSPQSLEEIGKRFNISKEHVSRLKEKALRKLRNCSNAQVLMSCLS